MVPRQRAQRAHWVVLCALAAAMLAAGCDGGLVLNADQADRGLVVLLPGIDGRTFYSEVACRALADKATPAAVELRDWTAPLGPLFNQVAVERNREAAAVVAGRIRQYRRAHPGRPVYLIGHSGGTAIAVWAAESLGPAEPVDGIILLASSLSPQYDLSRALAASRGGIVSFYSPLDGGLLGAGTTLMGTMDGQHCPSAGLAGFQAPPSPAQPAQYAKLWQVSWQPAMAASGHGGGHFDYMGVPFLSAYVRPLVGRGAWDEVMLAALRDGRPPPDALRAN